MREQNLPQGTEPRRGSEAAGLIRAFDDLASLRIFARVFELQSFSEAARKIGVTPATVSKHIAALEQQLGTRLINRTTRRLFVTDAGAMLYERCRRVFDELHQAQADLSQFQAEPMGHLRVALPIIFGARRIAPEVPRFLRAHPKVTIEMELSVDKVDVFSEQIDIAVRIADQIEPGLVAIRLAPYSRVFCASPDYLARRGVPAAPEDLAQHDCLVGRGANASNSWPMLQDGRVRSVPVSGRLSANHGEPIRDAAVAGLGVCLTARWLVERELREGLLVEVLSEHAVQNRAIYAVLSQRGAMTPKVRSFVEFMRDCLSDLQ